MLACCAAERAQGQSSEIERDQGRSHLLCGGEGRSQRRNGFCTSTFQIREVLKEAIRRYGEEPSVVIRAPSVVIRVPSVCNQSDARGGLSLVHGERRAARLARLDRAKRRAELICARYGARAAAAAVAATCGGGFERMHAFRQLGEL